MEHIIVAKSRDQYFRIVDWLRSEKDLPLDIKPKYITAYSYEARQLKGINNAAIWLGKNWDSGLDSMSFYAWETELKIRQSHGCTIANAKY